MESYKGLEPSDSLESNAKGIFNAIFSNAPNLEKLSIAGILFDGRVNDYKLLANSIRSKKLKILELLSPISDINAFKMISKSLENSKIETLGFSKTSFHGSNQKEINILLEVIPRMKFLKHLNIDGQTLINKRKLFSALKGTNVENLSFEYVSLNDDDAVMLSKLITSSKLMALKISRSMISRKGILELEAAKEKKPGFNLVKEEQW